MSERSTTRQKEQKEKERSTPSGFQSAATIPSPMNITVAVLQAQAVPPAHLAPLLTFPVGLPGRGTVADAVAAMTAAPRSASMTLTVDV